MLYDPKWEVEQPVKELEPWQKTILKMIEVLEEKGWCQGHVQNEKGEVCLGGAYIAVAKNMNEYPFLGNPWSKITYRLGSPARWNDDPGRTKEQVINMLQDLVKSA